MCFLNLSNKSTAYGQAESNNFDFFDLRDFLKTLLCKSNCILPAEHRKEL